MNSHVETQAAKQRTPGFFEQCWSGQLPLWKALTLVNLLGFILAFTVSTAGGAALLQVSGVKIYSLLYMTLVLFGYLTFNFVTVWRSSPHPKVSAKGAIAKIWVVVFTGWFAFGHLRFLLESISPNH